MKKFGFLALLGMLFVLCVAPANARPLEKGMSGEDVRRWQVFLIGQGYMNPPALGNFSERTQSATIAFQKSHGLQGLGVVGDRTLSVARRLGFGGQSVSPSQPSGFGTSDFSQQSGRGVSNDPEFVKPEAFAEKRTFSGRTDMAIWATGFAARNDKLLAEYNYHRRAGHKRWCAGYQAYMASQERRLRQWGAQLDSTQDTLNLLHRNQRLNP